MSSNISEITPNDNDNNTNNDYDNSNRCILVSFCMYTLCTYGHMGI